MLDIRKLKELVRLMVANDLTELDLRDSEEQVTLRRQGVSEAAGQVVAASGRRRRARPGPRARTGRRRLPRPRPRRPRPWWPSRRGAEVRRR